MNTLAERIDWILRNCTKPDGAPWTAKEISLAAGLSQSHVGQIKRGTIPDPGGETLAAIARIVSVSAHWLLTGEGDPRAPTRRATSLATLADLHNWDALLPAARALEPSLPEWVWERLPTTHAHFVAHPTPAAIASMARVIAQHDDPPAPADAREPGGAGKKSTKKGSK